MTRESKSIESDFRKLITAKSGKFPKVGQKLVAPSTHGVYVIYGPKGTPAHVGRTIRGKKGLSQRLNSHLHGRSSFVITALSGKGSKLRGKYGYALLEIADPRRRALLEAYAIGHLCPEHIGLGVPKKS